MSENSLKRKAPRSAYKPGQSGNYGGRPKSTLNKTLAKMLGKRAKNFPGTNEEAIVAKVIQMASEGDQKMAEFIWDRMLGKPVQPLEHTGEGGGMIQVQVVSYAGPAAKP